MICPICKKREVTDVHYKYWKEKPLKSKDHRRIAKEHPDWFEYICTICHAKIHSNDPKMSELKRLVILRERAIKAKNMLTNQERGFSRIEYLIPDEWDNTKEIFEKKIKDIEKQEKQLLESGQYLEWQWLKEIKGIGVATASSLISYIDISQSPHSSNLISYCGLNPSAKRKKGMTEDEAKKAGVPFLKKTVMGIISDNFIKQRTPVYRDIFDDTKKREIQLERQFGTNTKVPNSNKTTVKIKTRKKDGKDVNGHANSRAARKMMQIFLQHYWVVSRQLHHLSTEPAYVNEKLKHKTYIEPPHIPQQIQPFNIIRTFEHSEQEPKPTPNHFNYKPPESGIDKYL